jgi:hypothetical protein
MLDFRHSLITSTLRKVLKRLQLNCPKGSTLSAAQQFCSLAVLSTGWLLNFLRPDATIATPIHR